MILVIILDSHISWDVVCSEDLVSHSSLFSIHVTLLMLS